MEIRIYGSDSPLSGTTKYLNDLSGTTAFFDNYYGDISNTVGIPNGFITGATNAGSIGDGIFKGVNGTELDFYRLSGGSNVTITLNGDTLVIDGTDTNTDNYITGGTLVGNVLVLDRTDQLSAVTVDFTQFLDDTNYYVTGSTYTAPKETDNTTSINLLYNNDSLTGYTHSLTDTYVANFGVFSGNSYTIKRNDGEQVFKLSGGTNVTLTNTGSLVTISTTDTNTDNYVTGGTLNGNSIEVGRTDTPSILTLSGGSNVTITNPLTDVFLIESTDTGEINTASNVGVGTGIFSGKSGTDLQFYSLSGGSNVTLSLNNDTIVIDGIDVSSLGTVTGATNIGGATELYSGDVNNSLQFRTLTGASPYKITTVVNGDKVELDIDEPKLTLWPLVVTGNKLISGGAAYLSGLDFSISPLVYIIGSTIYNYSGGTVTLTSGDTTYNRIDVIYADDTSNVGVIEGTPAPNPSKPEIASNQVEVTFVTVSAGATSPEIAITKIYDEALGSGGGEWDPTTNSPSTILTGSTGQAFSGTKSVEFANANSGHYVNFNVPGGYDTSDDNILSFYVYIPTAGSWDANRDIRIKLYSGTTIVGGNSVVSFGDSGNFGFDRTIEGTWQVVSIGLGSFVMTQPIVTDVRFEVISLGNPAGNNIDAYIDLIRFQQGAATVSPQNLWLSFKTDDNIVTIAETNSQQLTVIGGTNIQTTGNNSSKSLTIDLTSGIDATYIGNGSVSNSEFQSLSGVTSDIQSQLNSKVNYYVTGGTLNSNSVEIGRNDTSPILTLSGSSNVTITNPLTDVFLIQSTDTNTDNYVTGGTLNGNSVEIGRTDTSPILTLSGGSNVTITNPLTDVFLVNASGSFTSFNVSGDTGQETIEDSNTLLLYGGEAIKTSVTATDTVTFSLDITGTTSEGSPSTGDKLIIWEADSQTHKNIDWSQLPGSAGGETNTASNVGGGNGIFYQKSGVDLQFRSLVAGTNITITSGATTLTINSTATGGGGSSSRTTGSTTTTDATPTVVDTIDTLNDNATNLIEVYVKAYQSGGSQWGIWKRTLSVTKVSGTVTIREENADVDKQSTGLRANSLSFTVNSGNIDVYVTGIAATTIDWKSAYEVIL